VTERLFDWSARPTQRLVTVASLRAGKGRPARHAQVTADTAEEAAAAEAAGIEMVVCRATNVAAVRRGAPRVFVTAALGFAEAVAGEEVLRGSIKALTDGADAVLCTRRLQVVELLASEDIPVMGHLGFVPRKSTWVGRTRGVGKTVEEAVALWQRFRRLEDAGAFAVEAELVAAPLLEVVTKELGLVTVSLGSGRGGDVVFLFASDICGENDHVPRHARSWGEVAALRQQIVEERGRAFAAFRQEVRDGSFPGSSESVALPSEVLVQVLDQIGSARRR
jgi:3-methyl-2-oxobutanoate hydroxymethyltransferase